MENKTSRCWCFTINNYTDATEQMLKDFDTKVMAFGREVGESGTPHLQGYVMWKRNYRLSQLKKLVPAAHWEIAVAGDALNYAIKGEAYYFRDGRDHSSKRPKLHDVLADNSFTVTQIVQKHPELYVRYHSGIHKIIGLRPVGIRDVQCAWIFGDTGSGKTRYVFEREHANLYIVDSPFKWFDGYTDQPAILFDDFRAADCTFTRLLRLTDRYPVHVEVKGAMINLAATRIYFTCPNSIDDEFKFCSENLAQFKRRIHIHTHIKRVSEYVWRTPEGSFDIGVQNQENATVPVLPYSGVGTGTDTLTILNDDEYYSAIEQSASELDLDEFIVATSNQGQFEEGEDNSTLSSGSASRS